MYFPQSPIVDFPTPIYWLPNPLLFFCQIPYLFSKPKFGLIKSYFALIKPKCDFTKSKCDLIKSLFGLNKSNNDFNLRYGFLETNPHILANQNVGVGQFICGCCEAQRGVLEIKKGGVGYFTDLGC